MKKSLLALAVLGAFAGAASAQTNVTIYGLVDAGVQYVKVKDGEFNESVMGLESGLNGGSRLGFKGSEDLGGGLSAIFALENGFTADDGKLDQDSRLFGRQAFVGLQGGFGAVKLGRQYSPIFTAVDSVDPFATNLAGSMLQIFNTYGIRTDNTINYSLPNMGGFYGQVAYTFGESTEGTSANRQLGLSVGYANGPINAVVAYHNAKDELGDNSERTTFVGGSYDFGVAKAHAAFADNKGFSSAAAPFTAIYGNVFTAAEIDDVEADLEDDLDDVGIKSRDYMLGVSAPVSAAGKVMASYQRKNFRDLPVAGLDIKADVFAIGYIHALSKRTSLYTSASRMTADWKEAGEPSEEIKRTVFNVGVQHRF